MKRIPTFIVGVLAVLAASITATPAVQADSAPRVGPVAETVVPERQVPADYIRNTVCNFEYSGSWAGAYCPHRWDNYGPQLFRIRMRCHNSSGGYEWRYGPWRSGGDWLASSNACTNFAYPTRTVGQTTIQYSY